MANILIVDDEENVRCILCDMLKSLGHQVNCLSFASDMYKILSGHKSHYDLVISDIHLEGENGIENVELARAFGNNTPVLFISGMAPEEHLEDRFLPKPFCLDELNDKINKLLK